METCRKCGAELRSEQKVCIKCGTRTVAGGNYFQDEKKPFEITRNMKYAGAGILLLLLIALVVRCLTVVPPDTIAERWFDAMLSRNYNAAERFQSQRFADQLQQNILDTRALSDNLWDQTHTQQGKAVVGAVVYDEGNTPPTATVDITISFPDGRVATTQVVFGKYGRRWLIDNVIS